MPSPPTLPQSRAFAIFFVAAVVAWPAHAQTRPPAAPIRGVTDAYFGVPVPDPYRNLENPKDPEVASWMKAQAAYTRATLDRIPGRAALLARITELGDAAPARVTGLQINRGHYYYLKHLPDKSVPKLYVRASVAGSERLLVDPGAVKGARGQIDYFAPSFDNRYLAYGISPGGSDDSVLHVIEVATGRAIGEGIDRTPFGPPSWTEDNRLLYNRLQKPAPGARQSDKFLRSRVHLHALGEDPGKDPVLLGPGVSADVALEPPATPIVLTTPGSPYLIGMVGTGNQRETSVYAATLGSSRDGPPAWRRVASLDDGVTDATVIGGTLYLLLHGNAPRFKVVRIDLARPDLASAAVVVPESGAVITGIAAASDALYVRRMTGGISDLLRVEHAAGAKPVAVKLPFAGDIDALAADPRVPGVVFSSGTWTRLGGYYAYDPKSAEVVDTRLQPQGRFDNPGNLVATEVKVKARDGTLVPLSIVHRKGLKLDGTNPAILYGYGAYGISLTPSYRPQHLAWFERDGIFAVAHVRGGGENGEAWYRGGFQQSKPNTWRDAIACAEWLVANGYTSPAKLAIEGGSAGGIFAGRSITERPDLFAAAIEQSPVSDAVRSSFEAGGDLDKSEWGTTETEAGFRALLAMSPYHHVSDGVNYPALLVLTGSSDQRVDAWQGAKMAARLQAASASGKPVLLRVDYDDGRGSGATRRRRNEELADTLSFLLWQFGVKGFGP
jgi:prolyl oligopeptidase